MLKHQNIYANNKKTKKSEEPKLDPLAQHLNSLKLDFDYSSQSIYSQPNQNRVAKFRTQR